MKTIFVKDKDLGFFTQTEIPVQRYETIDGEKTLVWCNHAGAEIEQVEKNSYNPDGVDDVWFETVHTCTCGAVKWEDNLWEDTPEEGAF